MSGPSGASGRGANQGRVGTLINGQWRIDARIGSGGMASVYAATHRDGHRAALKMLHAHLSHEESVRARFLREGAAANAVGHPGVVHVEDVGVTEDGAAFLVLELLEGEDVETLRLAFGGAMPLDEVLEIADQALDALAAAHEKGIVHRDVKPDNVFVTREGRVKLLDFGLARTKDMQGGELTKTGVTIGTPAFMPPEQAQGRRDEVDARSDVWGVGATLFTLITGKYVHDANTLHEQLMASATRRPPSILAHNPALPAAIAIAIDRALELEKTDRWASAREMQRALRAARGAPHGALPSGSLPSEPPTVPNTLDELPSTDRPGFPEQQTERLPMAIARRRAQGFAPPAPTSGRGPDVAAQARAARAVVVVSVLLILACAGVGTYVLLNPRLARPNHGAAP